MIHSIEPRPGMCPMMEEGMVGACVEHCAHDMDCWGKRKCCSTGCGHVCLEPLQGKHRRLRITN